MTDPAAQGSFWARIERDVVVATGPEAGTFLQGQLSQDLTGLGVGQSTWSWLLAPNGKVDALLRVTRGSDEEWILDTDAGWGRPVMDRLARFKLRTKLTLEAVPASVIALRGDGWGAGGTDGGPPHLVIRPPWPDQAGADIVYLGVAGGPTPVPELPVGTEFDPAGYEAWRIAAGIPRMGSELTERTIPAETGLVEVTVSFTKGCYTGQELVARIDSRGSHVARTLWVLRLDPGGDPEPEPGTEILAPGGQGTPAGTLTSVAPPGDGPVVALGYIRRGIEAGTELTAGAGGPAVEMVRPAGPGRTG